MRAGIPSSASSPLPAATGAYRAMLPSLAKAVALRLWHFSVLVLDTVTRPFLHLNHLLRSGKAEFCTASLIGVCSLRNAARPQNTPFCIGKDKKRRAFAVLCFAARKTKEKERNTMKNETKKHRFRAVAVAALALTLCCGLLALWR